MSSWNRLASAVSLGLELVAVVLVAIGGTGAVLRIGHALFTGIGHKGTKKVFVPLAGWLVVALGFTLAADVVRTSIAPSWADIGRLGAITVIRTFLNIFLGRDLERASAAGQGEAELPA